MPYGPQGQCLILNWNYQTSELNLRTAFLVWHWLWSPVFQTWVNSWFSWVFLAWWIDVFGNGTVLKGWKNAFKVVLVLVLILRFKTWHFKALVNLDLAIFSADAVRDPSQGRDKVSMVPRKMLLWQKLFIDLGPECY